MQIQWYPGHMTKARRLIEESLKLIDVVIEIVDARAPAATRNPDFDDLFAQKDRIVILNKSDLADPAFTKKWMEHFKATGASVLEFVATSGAKRTKAIELIDKAVKPKVDKLKEKGMNKTVRAMVVGIPNVGKSTFINRIAGTARTLVGDRPGVTKGKQWVKITPYLELMDTPGLLWPKIESQKAGMRLAYIGSVRDEVIDGEELTMSLLYELNQSVHEKLKERYKKVESGMQPHELLDAVCKSRGFVMPGNRLDTERAASVVLDEFRGGKIAKVTLELPGQAEKEAAEETVQRAEKEEAKAQAKRKE